MKILYSSSSHASQLSLQLIFNPKICVFAGPSALACVRPTRSFSRLASHESFCNCKFACTFFVCSQFLPIMCRYHTHAHSAHSVADQRGALLDTTSYTRKEIAAAELLLLSLLYIHFIILIIHVKCVLHVYSVYFLPQNAGLFLHRQRRRQQHQRGRRTRRRRCERIHTESEIA